MHRSTPSTLVPVLSLLLLVPATVRAQHRGPPEEVEAVRSVLVEMWAALERGDLEDYAEHVHPEFTSFGESDVYRAEGKELELESMGDWLDRGARVHTEMLQPRITVRGDVAWITYHWRDWGSVGVERYASRGKSTRIFVKEDGRWLCVHGHYTAVP